MIGKNEAVFKLQGQVNMFRVYDNILYALVKKSMLVQINVETGEMINVVQFANTSITNFIIQNKQLIFGTIANTMEIYDIDTFTDELKDIQPKKVITGLSGWILSMNVLDQYLYTGGDDKMIHVWSLAKDF